MDGNDIYKNLECMNGWQTQPIEYIRCIQNKHRLVRVNLGNCYNEYRCDICKIKYTVDSSG